MGWRRGDAGPYAGAMTDSPQVEPTDETLPIGAVEDRTYESGGEERLVPDPDDRPAVPDVGGTADLVEDPDDRPVAWDEEGYGV